MKLALEFFGGDEFAASTFLNKYALRDKDGNILEEDPNQTILRVMKILANATPEEKNIPAFYDEQGNPTTLLSRPSESWLKRVLKEDYIPFRSDTQYTWLEIFVNACNKFKGVCPQGSILSAAGNDEFPQSLSNCFVVPSPHDSMAGIMRTGEQEAQLMKRRGGVGVDISSLRPKNSGVANAARTSSGAVGWMEHFSNVCRAVGQNGRRGALMISLSIKHPDAEDFAKIKKDRTKVTGANVSLRISDEFMEAVYNNTSFIQQFPIEGEAQVSQEVSAKELWRSIIECAHDSAEPGLLFWDNCIKNLPAHCYPEFKSISTNPCAEIILSAYDSCRLITMCLTNYVKFPFTKNAEFDFVAFERDVRIAMRMMDAVVSAEIEHVEKILEKARANQKEDSENKEIYDLEINLWENIKAAAVNGRRTGLGTHGLGDTLAQLCLKYDSDGAIEMVDKIYSSLRNFAYDESVEMAKEFGPFPVYDFEKEQSCEFIKRLPEELLAKMKKYGRRNIAILTNAPTGSISILSQVSSGIEPTFRQMYIRRRKLNQNDDGARVDFIDQSGDKWTEFPIFEKNVQRYFTIRGIPLPDIKSESDLNLPSYFITSDKISWKKRVEIQATAQRYIDHSISSTINLPNEVTVEEVAEVYEHSHKMGLKGVTVYRDGCRTGVLVSEETQQKQKQAGRPETINRHEAPKRNKSMPCEVHITTVGGEEYVVIVSFLGDSIYEVFAGEHRNHLPEKKFSGEMVKQKEGVYILKYEHKGQIEEVDVNKYFKNDQYAALTRLVSTALRHGTPISFIVEQLMKATDSFFGFEKSLARVLKKYSKKEDVARKILANAGTDDIEVKFEDGCMTVINHTKNTVESKCD